MSYEFSDGDALTAALSAAGVLTPKPQPSLLDSKIASVEALTQEKAAGLGIPLSLNNMNDGDTFAGQRILGIDTPEAFLSNKANRLVDAGISFDRQQQAALASKDTAREYLNNPANNMNATPQGVDKFGRPLVEAKDYANYMLDHGAAAPMDRYDYEANQRYVNALAKSYQENNGITPNAQTIMDIRDQDQAYQKKGFSDYLQAVPNFLGAGAQRLAAGLGDFVLDAVTPGDNTWLNDAKNQSNIDKAWNLESLHADTAARGQEAELAVKQGRYLDAIADVLPAGVGLVAESAPEAAAMFMPFLGVAGRAAKAANQELAVAKISGNTARISKATEDLSKIGTLDKILYNANKVSGLAAISGEYTNNQLDQYRENTGQEPSIDKTAEAYALNFVTLGMEKLGLSKVLESKEAFKLAASLIPSSEKAGLMRTIASKVAQGTVGTAAAGTVGGVAEFGQEYLQTWAEILNENKGTGFDRSDIINDPANQSKALQGALLGAGAGSTVTGTAGTVGTAADALGAVTGYANNKLETKAAFNAENPSYVAQNKAMQGNADLSPLLAVDEELSKAKGYVDEVTNEDGTVTKTPYNPLQRMADILNEFQDKHSKLTEIFNSPEVAEANGDATDTSNPEHIADMMYNTLGTYNEKLDKASKEAIDYAKELQDSGKLTESQRNAINGQLKAIEQAKIEFQDEENSTLVKYYDQYINKTDDPAVQVKAAQAQAQVTLDTLDKRRDDFVRDPERAQTALERITKGISLQSNSDSEQRVAAEEVSESSKKLLDILRAFKAKEEEDNPENISGSSNMSERVSLHGDSKGTQYTGKLTDKSAKNKYEVASEILFGTSAKNEGKHRGVLQATAQVAKYNAILSSETSTASEKYTAAEKLHNLVEGLTAFHNNQVKKLGTIRNKELKEQMQSLEIPAIAAVLKLANSTINLHKDTHTIAAEDIMEQKLANPKNTDEYFYKEYGKKAEARNKILGWNEPSDRVAVDTIRSLLARQTAEFKKRAEENIKQRKASIPLDKQGTVKTSVFTMVGHNGETQEVNLSSFIKTKENTNNSIVAFGQPKQSALDSITNTSVSKDKVNPVIVSTTSDVNLHNNSYQKAIEELAAKIDSEPSSIQSKEDAVKKAENNKTTRGSIINAAMRLARLGTEAVNDPRNFIARVNADNENVKRLNNINDRENPNGIVKPLKFLLGLSPQNKLTLPPNIALAASTAVLEYIKSSGSTIGYRTDDDVMKAFGIPYVNSDPVAQMSMAKLKSLGTLRSVAAKEIGRTIYNALNIEINGNAPANLETQLIGALGALAIEMAVADGILSYKEIPVEDLQTEIRNAGGPGQIVKDKDAKVGFITYNHKNKDSTNKLREELRGAGSVFKAILGESFVSRKTGATLEADSKVTANANKGLEIPSAMVKILTKIADKTTYKFNPQAMNNLYTKGKIDWNKAVNVITSITGLPNLTAEVLRNEDARIKWANDNFNIGIRDFQRSILEGELLQIAKLDEAVNNLGGYDTVVSKDFPGFKLPRVVWKQGRVGIESSDINIQESKLHRSMVQVAGTYTKVSSVEDATSDHNLMRLAALAGVDEKKSPYEVMGMMNSINTELKDLVASDIKKLIAAIKAFNEDPTVEAAQAIKELLPKDSLLEKTIEEGYDGIIGAYELGNTILTMTDSNHSYESRINIEVDGVTNGFGFSLAFNPIFSDPRNTISYLEKVGINFYAEAGINPITNGIQAAREKAKNGGTPFTDSYQTLASALVAALRGDTSIDLARLSKLFPNIFILNGDMYDIARDFTKNPFMVFNYGSAIKSIKDGVKTNLYYKLLGEISKAHREGNISRLNDIAKTLFKTETEQKKFMSSPLEYKLDRAILDNMTAPVANHIGDIIEQQIGDLILPKEIVNASFNKQMAIYRQILKYELDKVRGGDSKRTLTVNEVKAVITKVSPFIPRFNHIDDYISGKGKDKFKEGWPAFKLQPGETTNVEIEIVFSTSNQKSMKYNVSDKELAEAGVSGYVLMVHNADGYVMTQALGKLVDQDISVLDVHDAVKVGANQVEPSAIELNTAFGDLINKYSIVDNALQSLEGAYEQAFQEYGMLFNNDRSNMVRFVHNTLDKEADADGIFAKIEKYNKNLSEFNKYIKDNYLGGTTVISQYAAPGGKGNTTVNPDDFIRPLINIPEDSILALGRDVDKNKANALYASVDSTSNPNTSNIELPVDQDKLDEVVTNIRTMGANDNVLSTIGTMLETGLVSDETHKAVLSTLLDHLSLIQASRERKHNKTADDKKANEEVAKAMKALKGITQTDGITNREVLAGIKTLLTAYFNALLKSDKKDPLALKAIKHIVPLLGEIAGIKAKVKTDESNLGEILASVFTAPENFRAVANSQIMARDATLKAQPSSISFKADKTSSETKEVTPSMITHLKRALTDMFNGITNSDKGFKEYEENKTVVNTMGELIDLISTVTANKTRNAEGDFRGAQDILARADIALSKIQDSARIDALKALHTKYLTEGDC